MALASACVVLAMMALGYGLLAILGEKYPDVFLKDSPVKIVKPDGSVLIYDPNTGQIQRQR